MTPKHYAALAKMLPDKVEMAFGLAWKECNFHKTILDTELLHLCWLVEETFQDEDWHIYQEHLITITKARWKVTERGQTVEGIIKKRLTHATPEQRIEAASKVKGIEI